MKASKRLKRPVERRRLITLARHPMYVGGNEVRAMALQLLAIRKARRVR